MGWEVCIRFVGWESLTALGRSLQDWLRRAQVLIHLCIRKARQRRNLLTNRVFPQPHLASCQTAGRRMIEAVCSSLTLLTSCIARVEDFSKGDYIFGLLDETSIPRFDWKKCYPFEIYTI